MSRFALLLAGVVAVAAPLAAARADVMTMTYYTISSSDPDANHLTFGTFTNEVQDQLGADGLPVLNIPAYGCTSNCFTIPGAPGYPNPPAAAGPNANVNASGEITYWSTTNPWVTETSQVNTSLPFSEPSNFFPPNGTGTEDGGSSGFQAATLMGYLDVPTTEQISFNIGSDDMAFAYLDGKLVCSDGGVHASTSVACTTLDDVTAGEHLLQLFFVDINTVQSGLTFSVTTEGVTETPLPEPASMLLIATGLMGLGFVRYRARG